MGLDVSFYASATMVHGEKHPRALTEPQPGPSEECYDTYEVVYVNPHFRAQADGLLDRSCWETGKRDEHIGQSYSGYNRFRSWLAMAAHAVAPEVIWSAPEQWWDKPFVRLIHFSDCEGTIGPDSSTLLAADFARYREKIADYWLSATKPFDVSDYDFEREVRAFIERYDRWAAAFAQVGPTGFVVFR